jgi:peptidoglycan/LPS O-acetylase OafA/YrhL
MTKSATKFRYDINALRAIAVFGVLLFHFKIPYFGGGFSGVDIFFVISGYLMTRIILNGLNKYSFSFLEFYGKRLNRIVPALIVLVLGLTILCFFFYFPADYMLNEKNAAASLLFLSNIFYWRNSGYFDPSSETNILLHTWSLSLEWQFYLIYPVMLLVLQKFFKDNVKYTWFFIAVTFLTMVLSMYFTKESSTASFYLLPTRSWEMMFGGVAFLLENRIKSVMVRKVASLIGYLSLFVGLCLLNTEMEWPGIFTFIPVFSTFLIILSDYSNFKIVKNNCVQFLGKISYSLYLWHWPVYVISKYFGVETTLLSVVSILSISMILGYLSYRYIESIDFKSNNLILAGLTIITSFTIFLGFKPINSFMFKPSSIELVNYEEDHVDMKRQFSAGCCFISSLHQGIKDYNKLQCLRFEKSKRNILLIGDSHAAQLSLSMREALAKLDINLLQATSSGCSPVKRLNGELRCSEVMDFIYNDFIPKNAGNIDGVFLCANWLGRAGGDNHKMVVDIRNTIKYLNRLNIPILLIGQNETYTMSYTSILAKENEYGIEISRGLRDLDGYKVNDLLEVEFKDVYVNVINASKVPKLSSSNDPYMFDENHFTKYGADITINKIFSDPFTRQFINILSEKNPSRKGGLLTFAK